MNETLPGMVIIGAGECGARAAFALREEGYAGPVTLIGAERHLPYERPPLSKDALAAEAPGIRTIAEADRFEAADIRLMLSCEVAAIDRAARAVRLGDGTALPYDAASACDRRPAPPAAAGRGIEALPLPAHA